MATNWLAVALSCCYFFRIAAGDCCPGRTSQNCTAKDNIMRLSSGRRIGDKLNSLTVSPRGPMLLQDVNFIEEISHFDRERIPDRVVHARGSGAFGYFEVTDDIRRFTKANVFNRIGKRTDIAVRFSIAVFDVGSADTVRDFRGFAVKFYTEEGNWDIVGNNIPVFSVRDSLLFPSFIHMQRRSPDTNVRNVSNIWDFVSLNPEMTAAVLFLDSDLGIPFSYRHMDGFGINTFKLVNGRDQTFYCKFLYLTDQGVRNLLSDEAEKLAGTEPDFLGKDLYNSIQKGKYPSWTLYIQVMTLNEANTVTFNPFDPTKEWPEEDFPLIRVGKLVLNRNPKNYFADVEQMAFSPSNLVPGIEPSPDKVLQGRIFSYPDTQRYRLGINFNQLPVNCPFRSLTRNYERDGQSTYTDNGDGGPNYFPNSYGGPVEDPGALQSPFQACDVAIRYDSQDEDNFSQPRRFYQRLDDGGKKRLAMNIAKTLGKVESFIQERQLLIFRQVHPNLEKRVKQAIADLKDTSS